MQKDGSFTAKKNDGKALPAGSYKVSLVHYPPVDAGGQAVAAAKGGVKGPQGPPTPKNKTAGETWDVSSSLKSFTL